MFMLKNMDAQNISNARIMNLDTDQNIMTQLGLSSNAYGLLPVVYYVSRTQIAALYGIDVRSRSRTSSLKHLRIYCLRE